MVMKMIEENAIRIDELEQEVIKYKQVFAGTFEMLLDLRTKINQLQNKVESTFQFGKNKIIEMHNQLYDFKRDMEREIKQLPDECIDDKVFIDKVKNCDAIFFVTKEK